MKIKKGFMLCPTMGKTMAIATGDLVNEFQGIVKMNEPTVDIWHWIEEGKELEEIYSLYESIYDVDAALAKKDVDGVVKTMGEIGILE